MSISVTSENSDLFRGYRSGTFDWNGLTAHFSFLDARLLYYQNRPFLVNPLKNYTEFFLFLVTCELKTIDLNINQVIWASVSDISYNQQSRLVSAVIKLISIFESYVSGLKSDKL